jgi:aminopeptidase N
MRRLFCLALASVAALGFAQRKEPHNYDLLDVAWHVSYDQKSRVIHGEVTNTIQIAGPGAVWFDCGPLSIEQVTVDGSQVPFNLDGEKLTVGTTGSGRKRVSIRYSGSPTAGVYFVDAAHAYPAKTGMVYTQGEAEDNRYWLPTYDFPDDKATAEGWITVPPGQYALSNGKLVGIEKKADGWTYHWRESHPMSTYLISFVAGEYSEGKERLGGLPVSWIVPKGTERWGQAAFAGTNRMIDFYNHLTGFNYAWEKFSQSAVADFMFGGMENASCVTQTIRTLHKPENEPLANSEGLVAHELAHQWFGDTVTCANWSHNWLNEGFATFLPNFWFGKSRGQDALDVGRYDTFFGAIGSQAGTRRPVVYNKYEVPMDLFDGQAYGGGAARLFTLMGQVGEAPFWAGVKAYLNEFKFKNATTEDFFSVMSRVTKRDLSTFRQQFFYTAASPSFTVSRRGSDVVVRQLETPFDLDLTLTFVGKDDIDKVIPIHLTGKETVVSAPGFEADPVVLDYPVTAMARINYESASSGQDLLRIWRFAPNAAAKLMVLGRFGDKLTDEDWLDVARDEKSPVVLNRLLPRLKKNAIPFLLQLTHGFDRTVADSAVSALKWFNTEPEVSERLKEIWAQDHNELLQNNALSGLLNASKDRVLADEAWSRDSQWEMFRISALNWFAEHEPKEAYERCIRILEDRPNEPLDLSAVGLLARLKNEDADRKGYRLLIQIAQEPSYGLRMAAVNALASYGDKAAIPVIEPLTKSSLFFTRRAAAAAIARLKGS